MFNFRYVVIIRRILVIVTIVVTNGHNCPEENPRLKIWSHSHNCPARCLRKMTPMKNWSLRDTSQAKDSHCVVTIPTWKWNCDVLKPPCDTKIAQFRNGFPFSMSIAWTICQTKLYQHSEPWASSRDKYNNTYIVLYKDMILPYHNTIPRRLHPSHLCDALNDHRPTQWPPL